MKTIFIGLLAIICISCSKNGDDKSLPSIIIGEWRFVKIFDKTQSARCWECPDFIYDTADPVLAFYNNDSINIKLKIENHELRGNVIGSIKSENSINSNGDLKISFDSFFSGFIKDINELLSANGKFYMEEIRKVNSYNLPHHASTSKFSFIELYSNQYVLILAKKK